MAANKNKSYKLSSDISNMLQNFVSSSLIESEDKHRQR